MPLGQGMTEFEFVDDAAGGQLVMGESIGNVTSDLLKACAGSDLDAAVRLFEDHGADLADELVSKLASAPLPVRENAAKVFVRARDFGRAARVLVGCKRWPEAARCFEQVGDFISAGKCLQAAGDLEHAAAAYDRAGQVDVALKLYEKANAREAMADCLARHGRLLEAADLYEQQGNARGQVEALRNVRADDPGKPAAARRLATLLDRYDRASEATQHLVETARLCPAARNDSALFQQLVALFEKQGMEAQAKKAREHLVVLGSEVEIPLITATPLPADDYPPRSAYEILKSIPIFAELSAVDMKDLYRIAEERRFTAGCTVVEADAEAPGLLVLVEGEAEVLTGGDARRLNELKPGSYLGEISLLQKGRTSARVVARTPIRALAISREQFEHYAYAHHDAALRIWRLFAVNLAERVRALST